MANAALLIPWAVAIRSPSSTSPSLPEFATNGRPFVVMGFTFAHGKIVEIDCYLDPERLARIDLAGLDGTANRSLNSSST